MKLGRRKANLTIDDIHEYDINLDTREIYLSSYVEGNEDSGFDYRNSNRFLKNIRLLESVNSNPIFIHQYSIGGEWDSGIMIYDLIKASPCKIIFFIHGIAASMGSIIPQAADVRIMMPRATFMVHEGSIKVDGEIRGVKSVIEIQQQNLSWMIDLYANVCAKGAKFKDKNQYMIKKFIRARINKSGDWYMSAKEAIEYGFADAILEDKGYESIEKIRTQE